MEEPNASLISASVLSLVRQGKVSHFLVKITAGRASERYPECCDETARVLVPDSEHCRGNAAPSREVLKASEQALAPPARQKHKH
jgi:hypothetical protein